MVFVGTLSENLKKYRKRKGLPQTELAQISHVSLGYIQRIEQGVAGKRIGAVKLKALADALGVTQEELQSEPDHNQGDQKLGELDPRIDRIMREILSIEDEDRRARAWDMVESFVNQLSKF